MRKLLLLLLSLIMCVAMISGCNDSTATTGTTASTTAAPSVTGNPNASLATRDPNASAFADNYILPLPERTAWNIEMSFVKYKNNMLIVRICDNDNQGFYLNDLYYELEILRDGNWVKITRLNEASHHGPGAEYGYVFPSEVDDYVDTWSYNHTIALKEGVTLETGHYRLTKILSGRKISFEFDMVIE